jgi:CheY-like chemotaxis protein
MTATKDPATESNTTAIEEAASLPNTNANTTTSNVPIISTTAETKPTNNTTVQKKLPARSPSALGSTLESNAEAKSVSAKPASRRVKPGSSAVKEFTNCTVLCVDDHDINRKIVARLLERVGFKVHLAMNGREAVDLVQQNSEVYSFVLMDLQMDIMDGHEATTEIRRRGIQLPIIALTGSCLDIERRKCHDEGMNAFLAKPIQDRELMEVCRKYSKPKPQNAGKHLNSSLTVVKSTSPETDVRTLQVLPTSNSSILQQGSTTYEASNLNGTKAATQPNTSSNSRFDSGAVSVNSSNGKSNNMLSSNNNETDPHVTITFHPD